MGFCSRKGYPNAKRGTRSVGPLLETTRNQNKYYNSHCPIDPDCPDDHVFAGCVATAMAQVMRYWNHPFRGKGSHSYTPGEAWGIPYPTQTANFGDTYYHFEKMPFFLDSTSTEESIFYIAQLLHHCGIALEMIYGPNVSESSTRKVPETMSSYFGYSESHVEIKGPKNE